MQAILAAMPLPIASPAAAGRQSGLATVTDEELMLRFGRGEQDAFEELYRRHRAGLHRFIRRMIGPEADEIFQDVWLSVVKARTRYVPSARFVTYLFTIAHHCAVARLRRRGLYDDELSDNADDAPGPFETTLGGEIGEALKAAIAALPVAQREAFLMQAEGGLSLEEIAAACGAPRETVKSRLRYANRRLRAALEGFR